jgi:GAF domain-containing protein
METLEDRLADAIERLSRARTLDQVMRIVRRSARDLSGADGVTFVLRDGDRCYYAEENAIGPLWKGKRFPLASCISGWVMTNRQPVSIPDVFADPRIPTQLYRPTFVKSMAMVPVRDADPVGAIGAYWAEPHHASEDEVRVLHVLADASALALSRNGLAQDGLGTAR